MATPVVHFAVGMAASALVVGAVGTVRRRWLIALPVAMTVCGALALVPDFLAAGVTYMPMVGSRAWSHSVWMNVFFLHPLLDRVGWLETSSAASLGFQAVALLYLAAACGCAAYIRWGIPRVAEAPEVLERLRAKAAVYRPVASLVGIVPLLLLGGAAGWLTRSARVPEPMAAHLALARWSRLVHRRMRLTPGERLGMVSAASEEGEWLVGDLGAHSTFSGGAATLADVVERAQAQRCQFVVLADGTGLTSSARVAEHAAALAAARAKFRDIAILGGLAWDGGGSVLVAPQADESALLAGLRGRLVGATAGPPREALRWLAGRSSPCAPAPVALAWPAGEGKPTWDEMVGWLRTSEVFVGILGLPVAERGATRGRWDPRVAQVGGTWDTLLDRGFQVWGAAAASGFRDPAAQHWPGEHVRTHVWCRGRRPAHVLEGLRSGCFWADEAGIVKALRLELLAPHLERPAGMGEVAWVAPGAATSVELTLELPATDLTGREGRVDEVELISNFSGEPEAIQRFRAVQSGRLLRFALPPAEDRNGGVGFYVRARGVRRLAGGAEHWFTTNPIRVLVHAGTPPRAEEPAVVGPSPKPSTATPPEPKPRTPLTPKPGHQVKPDTTTPIVARVDPLDAIGLPRSIHVVELETFDKKPGRHWRGEWTTNVAQRGAAMGDDGLGVSIVRQVAVGEAARLFFRCYAKGCGRLTVLLHTTQSGKPYERVFELEESKWQAFDLSLRDDFHPPLGASARLGPADPVVETEGDEIRGIEWKGEGLTPTARFYIGDFVVYERTMSARADFARLRVGEPGPKTAARREGTLEQALAEAAALGKPSQAWQARADAVVTRLAACRETLYQDSKLAVFRGLGAAEQELDELADEIRLLGLQARMARAFGIEGPTYVLGVMGATERVSARNPALAFDGPVAHRHALHAAAGEAESIQLVVHALWEPLRAVDVTWTGFEAVGGARAGLPPEAVAAAVSTEIWVHPRADLPRSRTGWMPDPLGPFLPFDVEAGSLRSVVLTVRVPPDLPPGDYKATVTVRPLGKPAVSVAVSLRRWDFALADSHLPVIGPIDERAILDEYGLERGVPQARRRALYGLLLRHRVSPVPLLVTDEAASVADLLYCFERGMALGVVHRAGTPRALAGPAIERAAGYASKVREAGWGHGCAVFLPLLREARDRGEFARESKAFRGRYPAVQLIAGGHGEPPAGTAADYWRQPLGIEALRRPSAEAVAVRRTRTTRLEAWELGDASPDYPDANLTLTNRLAESRVLAWLAWRHGVRALVLDSVNAWRAGERGRGVLVYPGPAGDFFGSLRLVALRDGVEDYEYLWLLWDRSRRLRERAPQRHLGLLAAVDEAAAEVDRRLGTMAHPTGDAAALAALRLRIGRLLERLEAAWWEEVDSADDLPKPPPRLAARAGDERVSLSWQKSPEDEVGAYHVYRSTDPKIGFARITALPVEALAFEDATVRNDETYYYFVRSCLEGAQGPRSQVADATPKPTPKVVWGTMADLTRNSTGPYRIVLNLSGPGVGGVLPLVRPQIDYCLSDGAYDGFEEMTRSADRTWTFDVPDLGWARQGGKTLRVTVRLVDRRSRLVTPAVEHTERIDAGGDTPTP